MLPPADAEEYVCPQALEKAGVEPLGPFMGLLKANCEDATSTSVRISSLRAESLEKLHFL